MIQSRTHQHVLYLIALILLTLAACTSSAQPTQQPKPQITPERISVAAVPTAAQTLALPALDGTRLPTLPATQDLNQGARSVKEWLRDEIGLREQLGPQSDELFRLMDQAETEAVQEVLEHLQHRGKLKGMPAPLPPRTGRSSRADAFEAFAEALVTLSVAPDLISRPEYRDQDGPRPAVESDKELGENVRASVKVTPTVTGCHAEMDVEVTIHAEKDGVAYEDTATGHVSMTLCPDEAGKVPLDLTIDDQINVNSVHLSIYIADHTVGQVDDEANLASLEEDVESELDMPTGKNWFTGGVWNSSVRVRQQFRRTGAAFPNLSDGSVVQTGGRVVDASFPPSQDVTNRATILGPFMVWLVEQRAFEKAEEKWKDNWCVRIKGVDDSQHVRIGSETPFTASVRHEWEGKDLNVPVIATLTSGAVSVTPSGAKVPAPATFRYKAPDQSGKEATVELVSRSRRGIGKINVTFHTEQVYYRVNTVFGVYSKVPAAGDICALDKPFKLAVDGHNPSGGKYTGDIAFTPASADSGSWKHAASSCVAPLGCGTVSGNGTYQVEGLAAGHPVMKLNATTVTSEIKGTAVTYPWPAWQIDLKVVEGACSSQ